MTSTPTPADAFLGELRALPAGPARFERALALTLAHFRADSGTIHRLSGGLLHLAAHSAGMPPQVLEIIRTIPIGKGMAGLAVERGAPVTACNLQTDTSGDVRPGARATGLQGSIVVPMRRGRGDGGEGEVVGALGIANRGERTFTEPEVELLLAAGSVLAGF